MSKFVLIVCALVVLATVTVLDFSHAADLKLKLETYKDPGGRFSMDIPKGWSSDPDEDFVLFLENDLVSFGLMKVDDLPEGYPALDFLPSVIEEIKSSKKVFAGMRIVKKPVLVTGGLSRLASAQVAYKRNGTSSFVTDFYIICRSDGTPLYTMVTYIPAADEPAYRNLFKKIACSISLKGATSAVSPGLARFTLETGRSFTVQIPDSWTKKYTKGMLVSARKGEACVGLFEAVGLYRVDTVKDYLLEMLKDMSGDKTFTDMRVITKVTLLDNTKTPVAHMKIRYKTKSKQELVSEIYVVGDSDGRPSYGFVADIPADDKDLHSNALEAMVRSVAAVENDREEPVKLETVNADVL